MGIDESRSCAVTPLGVAQARTATMNGEKGRHPNFVKEVRAYLEGDLSGAVQIVALQEVTQEMVEEICKGKTWEYRFVPTCHFNGVYRGQEINLIQGVATITTGSIVSDDKYVYSYLDENEKGELPTQTGDADEGNANAILLMTEVIVGDHVLFFLNTHGIWTSQGENSDRQTDGLVKMIGYISKNFPQSVLACDLNLPRFIEGNTDQPNIAHKILTDSGLSDHIPIEMLTTLNPRQHRKGTETDDVVVDYILSFGMVTRIKLDAISTSVISSDHLAVVAKFSFFDV